MEFVSAILGPVVNLLMVHITQKLGYLTSSTEHVKHMKNRGQFLGGQRDDIEEHTSARFLGDAGFDSRSYSINLKKPSKDPMWKGGVVAYIVVAICYFPVANISISRRSLLISMPIFKYPIGGSRINGMGKGWCAKQTGTKPSVIVDGDLYAWDPSSSLESAIIKVYDYRDDGKLLKVAGIKHNEMIYDTGEGTSEPRETSGQNIWNIIASKKFGSTEL
ncbi:hypothetical protein Tco_1217250 [Tanacetum coccineum]